MRQAARDHVKAVYQRMTELMLASPAGQTQSQTQSQAPLAPPLTLNTAGSPTYRLHDGSDAANEVSVARPWSNPPTSTPLLADLSPACFIATPVIKSGPFQAPNGVEWIGQLAQWWDRNQRHAVFIYGGHWLAQPVSPPGLAPSGLIGPSSNQQILLGSGQQSLRSDDFVFLPAHPERGHASTVWRHRRVQQRAHHRVVARVSCSNLIFERGAS